MNSFTQQKDEPIIQLSAFLLGERETTATTSQLEIL